MAGFLPTRPGWYPNPADRSTLRYWDGTNWSSRSRPRPPWLSGLADLEPAGDAHDSTMEGPVHPHELRQPVASGASARHGPALWRALQAQRAWHRPTTVPAGSHGPAAQAPTARFGPAGRPVMVLVVVVLVAAAVVMGSVAVMAPYEHAGATRFTAQPGEARFTTQAARDCGAVLPKERSVFLASSDGPTIAAASTQMDKLRARLATLQPASGTKALVQAWLAHWAQFSIYQRRYAEIIGPARTVNGRMVPQVLTSGAEAASLQARHMAEDEANAADHYVSDLRINSCLLGLGGPVAG